MAATTTRLAIPYPGASDPNNIPADLQRFANQLDALCVAYSQNTLANRPAASVAGRFYIATDTLTVYYDTGTAWITMNLAATVTTKGDLLAATGAGVLARLGVGADGQALLASSAAAGGLAYGTVTGQALALSGAGQATRYVGATTSGAPTSGTFLKGDCVIAQDGVEWICTAAGSPGTWRASHAAALGLPLPTSGATQATRWVGMTSDGAPTSGTYLTGDKVTDLRGVDWVCTAGGTPGNWTNRGLTTPVGHVGATDGAQAVTSAGVYVSFSTAQILRGGVTFNYAGSALIVPRAGLYRISAALYATGGSTPYKHLGRVTINDTAASPTTNAIGIGTCYKPDTDYRQFWAGNRTLAAGDALRLFVAGPSGSTFGTDGYGTMLAVEYLDQ